MMVIDPISDMLTRIRNALNAKHKVVEIPSSKFKLQIAKILQEEGFIHSFDKISKDKFSYIKISLKYTNDNRTSVIKEIKRISKPGLRVYVNKTEIPRIMGGLGTSIISTSKGVMTGSKAREIGVGGEILCSII
ncbi:30S ribosomal protein S8 [bacterium]|nr:30S ribosomal protein S8 [bacterium]